MNLKIIKESPIPYTLDLKFSWSNQERHLIIQPLYWGVMISIILITLSLGFWQMDRADQKEQQIQQLQESEQQTTSVTGQFLKHPTLLLDNQTYQGRTGYEVIRTFQVSSTSDTAQDFIPSKKVLVNVGWIAAPLKRSNLPNSTHWHATDQLNKLSLYPTNTSSRRPKHNLERFEDGIIRLQALNVEAITELHLPEDYYRLNLDQPNLNGHVLTTEHWKAQKQSLGSSPEKHIGYAIQWFLMSLAAGTILLFSSLSRENARTPNEGSVNTQQL